ncbi:MAG TPA: glucose-6-phosphate isomerase family protein [Candidatus Limnocylindrales bacterium]|nr:glucose-6-phosphate isomerase family protein [Candidatus Limnocylindrales bacterium]
MFMEPFAVDINLENGHVSPPARLLTRRLSDLKGLFSDEEAYTRALEKDNSPLYDVYEIPVPKEEGHLLSCTTLIYPGKIGNEYYFTKGHFHTTENRAEIYTCLQGEGYLLMATRQGDVKSIFMKPGVSAYIPPYWSHRTLNCGKMPFVFYGVWPGDAGHDYQSIVENKFPLRVLEELGKPVVKKY